MINIYFLWKHFSIRPAGLFEKCFRKPLNLNATCRSYQEHLPTYFMHCQAHRKPLTVANCVKDVQPSAIFEGKIFILVSLFFSHGCRYSCWNFMKLQHYFHILLTSRSKSSRTKSIHGLRRNQPINKRSIHNSQATRLCS